MPRRISKKQVKQEIYFKPVRKSTSTVADCQPALTITGPDLPIKYLYTGNGIRDKLDQVLMMLNIKRVVEVSFGIYETRETEKYYQKQSEIRRMVENCVRYESDLVPMKLESDGSLSSCMSGGSGGTVWVSRNMLDKS